MSVSVFVIDDHPVVAQGIELTLDGQVDVTFVGAAASVPLAESALRQVQPDLVLLDVRIPDQRVADAVTHLRKVAPASAILLFTADPRHPDIKEALRAGAVGVVAKDTSPPELRTVLVAVGRGLPIEFSRGASVLTPRQHDVLTRVAEGMTNAEIARELGLRPSTVKAYWQDTMLRLSVRNRAEAIAAAFRDGLL